MKLCDICGKEIELDREQYKVASLSMCAGCFFKDIQRLLDNGAKTKYMKEPRATHKNALDDLFKDT